LLKRVATVVLVICLTAWCLLILALLTAAVENGLTGAGKSLLHIAGQTREVGFPSPTAVVWRLGFLAFLTAGAIYAKRHHRQS